MALLVRKIEIAKWRQNNIISGADASADAITNCMKTTSNKLSTWKIENSDKINEAVLATISNFQKFDKTDYIILEETFLSDNGLKIIPFPGNTPVYDLIDTHYDIVDLTYSSLGILKNQVIEHIKAEKVIRITARESKKILLKAIDEQRVDIDKLHPELQSKIKKEPLK
ncbi:hypothetical protein H4684_003692 [Desulfomicrobium macestii]|uniref:Uncharacterized protein n=1 Tax=Desulfomicrobium macestii TaxID=90731 RepID=A0ABR9H8I5_9BACT|nr:hypothetical protein [Desulfomicrobium macestii]MBE1427008.1 hypothetical protein [Desulfomicrobium macestii]